MSPSGHVGFIVMVWKIAKGIRELSENSHARGRRQILAIFFSNERCSWSNSLLLLQQKEKNWQLERRKNTLIISLKNLIGNGPKKSEPSIEWCSFELSSLFQSLLQTSTNITCKQEAMEKCWPRIERIVYMLWYIPVVSESFEAIQVSK